MALPGLGGGGAGACFRAIRPQGRWVRLGLFQGGSRGEGGLHNNVQSFS